MLAGHDDDELPGSGRPGQLRMQNLEQERNVREVLPGYDLVPGNSCLVHLDPPVLLRFCPKLAAETIRVIADPDA